MFSIPISLSIPLSLSLFLPLSLSLSRLTISGLLFGNGIITAMKRSVGCVVTGTRKEGGINVY